MITVVKAPAYLTVQDCGRTHGRAAGVPPGGAMDVFAISAANAMVGNEAGAAGLEWALGGGSIRFERDCAFALAGARVGASLDGKDVAPCTTAHARAGSTLSVVNAFALPGGFVYVNRGVLARASNMSEVAGVLGHEIEHVVRRHSVKQMEQAQGANVGVGILCALTGVCQSGVAQAAINVGGSAVFAKFSRTDEVQADEGGFNNIMRAGINPRGMLTFFQKLLAEEQQSGSGNAAAWFSDHPGTSDRIADIQRLLSQVPASQLNSLATNESAFNSMKARLAQLGPAPKVQGGE